MSTELSAAPTNTICKENDRCCRKNCTFAHVEPVAGTLPAKLCWSLNKCTRANCEHHHAAKITIRVDGEVVEAKFDGEKARQSTVSTKKAADAGGSVQPPRGAVAAQEPAEGGNAQPQHAARGPAQRGSVAAGGNTQTSRGAVAARGQKGGSTYLGGPSVFGTADLQMLDTVNGMVSICKQTPESDPSYPEMKAKLARLKAARAEYFKVLQRILETSEEAKVARAAFARAIF